MAELVGLDISGGEDFLGLLDQLVPGRVSVGEELDVPVPHAGAPSLRGIGSFACAPGGNGHLAGRDSSHGREHIDGGESE